METSPGRRPLRIGIIGGGTAGLLAALTLQRLRPELELTLVESSRIPVIGVGEATTSEIVPFLHSILGFDPAEFYQKVMPTWKLGIKFVWGRSGDYCFNYPFDRGPLLESKLYQETINECSVSAALMSADRSPLLSAGKEIVSLLPLRPFGYHLDNRRFVRFLHEKARERGIVVLDRQVAGSALTPDGGSVARLMTEEGDCLIFDFYVDCTGFRSLLLEGALGSPFESYETSLFTDTAIVASAPHGNLLKPYTLAETMDHGWCWTIPQVEEDHLGYVHSSSFCSLDQAHEEMRARHPGLGEPWTVRFRSGRHRHFVRGNVAAIGNSYGFVEPLESTAIFVMCRESLLLAEHIYDTVADPRVADKLNDFVGSTWDYIRWFLSIHYRFNGRSNTPFWRNCRESVDISGAASIVDRFQKGAPLAYHQDGGALTDGNNFDAFGWDVLLLGQGVEASYLPPRITRERHLDDAKQIRLLVDCAVGQAEALAIVARRPELLQAPLAGDSWVSSFAKEMRRTLRV